MCPHAEHIHLVFARLVHFCQFAAQFVFGDIRSVGVENVTGEHNPSESIEARNFAMEMVHHSNEKVRLGTYTTICFLLSSLLVMNLRVRSVTGWSDMAAS